MQNRIGLLLTLWCAALLVGCTASSDDALPGTLEWDRVAVLAEAAKPVIELRVEEGDEVKEGALLLRLDAREAEAQLAQGRAEAQRLAALLDELRHGARRETITAQRAELARPRAMRRICSARATALPNCASRGSTARPS